MLPGNPLVMLPNNEEMEGQGHKTSAELPVHRGSRSTVGLPQFMLSGTTSRVTAAVVPGLM